MWNVVTLACLALWAFLFGLFSVTNIQVDWGRPIMGFAALILGTVCIIQVFMHLSGKGNIAS